MAKQYCGHSTLEIVVIAYDYGCRLVASVLVIAVLTFVGILALVLLGSAVAGRKE
jgi:hypothetical protein